MIYDEEIIIYDILMQFLKMYRHFKESLKLKTTIICGVNHGFFLSRVCKKDKYIL